MLVAKFAVYSAATFVLMLITAFLSFCVGPGVPTWLPPLLVALIAAVDLRGPDRRLPRGLVLLLTPLIIAVAGFLSRHG